MKNIKERCILTGITLAFLASILFPYLSSDNNQENVAIKTTSGPIAVPADWASGPVLSKPTAETPTALLAPVQRTPTSP